MSDEIQVPERIANLVQWANEKGQDEVRRLLRDRLKMLKEECSLKKGMKDADGFKWDEALEPNDDSDQWKHGGDCNLCRKISYCGTQCRANRLLKEISTHFLYECYLQENPQDAVKEAANGLTPDQLIERLGVDAEEVEISEQPVS